MKLALISVSDKSNLIDLVKFLFNNDYNIISTGGTYNHIIDNIQNGNIELNDVDYTKRIKSVSDFTGFPEILGGRVKTLHPKIYGGILYDPTILEHVEDYEKFNHSMYKLEKIDLIVSNLYPFNIKNATEEEIIEKIDIGGVTLIRAAAKIIKML